eukprot:TRINITY_DN8348_c0_g3_i5.p1 TRINITY_DN8348_c0_g3~~TRINITY_DN8348_c0_g3_i5.p1  ORF type:complete len:176 (-),score=31.90 TRINITY_DN8348_c0_g3_i5:349-876(-)
MKQLSPLVQDYVVSKRQDGAKAILKAIQDMLDRRRHSGSSVRTEMARSEILIDEHRGVVIPAEDAKRRSAYSKQLHETYVTTRQSCSRDLDKIHQELQEGFRILEDSRQRVLKGGESSVSQLTMKIMENQHRRKEVVQQRLQKMGYVGPSDPKTYTSPPPIEHDLSIRKTFPAKS